MNTIESTAMWDVYLRGELGVAIQSTVAMLDSAIQKTENIVGDVYSGAVNYLNEDESIPEPDGFNGLNAVMWKRNSYQHENELRAVAITLPEQSYKYNGVYIPVDLQQLVQKIIISPKAPRWYSELIFSVAEKYKLRNRVTASRLDETPGTIDDTRLPIAWICPQCQTSQKVIAEPFIIKELPNNSTILFSADRMSVHCQSCNNLFYFPLKHSEEEPDGKDSVQ